MNRFVSFFLTIAFLLTIPLLSVAQGESHGVSVGDKIQFGDYSWLVLAVEDGGALVVTEGIIEQRP